MKCVNCGADIKEDSIFCGVCGIKVINNVPPVNITNHNDTVLQVQNSTNNTLQNNMDVHIPNNTNEIDEQLLNIYIGSNVEVIKGGKFSWCTFFFGPMYVIYRKMWLFAISWQVGYWILVLFVPHIRFLLFIAEIILSVEFNKIYVKHAREEITKIKNENPSKSFDEISNICGEKGGTSILAVIIIIASFIALIFIAASGYSNTNINSEYSIQMLKNINVF